jgi:hypothetical protein
VWAAVLQCLAKHASRPNCQSPSNCECATKGDYHQRFLNRASALARPLTCGTLRCVCHHAGRPPSIDALIEAVGLGRWNLTIVWICGLGNAADAIEMMCIGENTAPTHYSDATTYVAVASAVRMAVDLAECR